MKNLSICVVYVNEVMFRCFFELNSRLLEYDIKGVDNRKVNEGLPAIYNRFINEKISEDCWLFFVHEDFDIRSDLSYLSSLDRDCIYGTFGVYMEGDVPVGVGCHTVSRKDGSNVQKVGLEVAECKEVETVDCQSILVHTSLFRKHKDLRFDENLSFDLYAEDLCINAKHNFGLSVKVFPLVFQHYSHGKITDRYYRGLEHLAQKYPDYAVPGSCSFIGGKAKKLEKKFSYDIVATKT